METLIMYIDSIFNYFDEEQSIISKYFKYLWQTTQSQVC